MKFEIDFVSSKTTYKMLMVFLGIFTLLDIGITHLGLSLGCVELNVFVNNLGLDVWSVTRLFLLAYLLMVYSVGYRMLLFHSINGLWLLKNSLFAIDIFIGAIAFSGIFHVISILIF